MACDLELVSLATVAWVVLLVFAWSMILSKSLALDVFFYVRPGICMLPFLSYIMFSRFLSFSKSRHLPPYISKYVMVIVCFFANSNNSWTSCDWRPSMVYVFPEPVCPYAKHVTMPCLVRMGRRGLSELV